MDNYEQKYKKALKKAQETVDKGMVTQNFVSDIFPELKESDDERIRKEIIDIIDSYDVYHLKAAGLPSRIPEYIAWLEKQGEQKSAWSEEDEITKNNISHIIRQYDKISKRENQPCWYVGDCLLWMQSIKDRVQPQSKQEWSEEDERMFNSALWHIKNSCGNQGKNSGEFEVYNWAKSLKDRVQPNQEWSEEDEDILKTCLYFFNGGKGGISDNERDKILNWLKSLRPQSHWKPSDEQMNALTNALSLAKNCGEENAFDLRTLYEQLKKLREE